MTNVAATFAADAAAKTGTSERTVRREVNRGEKIAPDVLDAVEGTPLDNGRALDGLAKLPAKEQRRAVAVSKVERRREAKPPRKEGHDPYAANRARDVKAVLDHEQMLAALGDILGPVLARPTR